MTFAIQRKHPRRRVHLRVAYRTARDFVEQYADNLSAGGLFVRDEVAVEVKDEVSITLSLPAQGEFTVVAEVMHVTREGARRGAGFQILRSPPGFDGAIIAYFMRLGRRPDAIVFVDAEPWRGLLADAGYQVKPLPASTSLAAVVGDARSIALMPPIAHAEQYGSALERLGRDSSLVIPIHDQLPVDPVLEWLDDKLLP